MRDEIAKPIQHPTPESLQSPDVNQARSVESAHQTLFHQYIHEPDKFLHNRPIKTSGSSGDGAGQGSGGQGPAEQAVKKHLPPVEVGTFGHN